MSDTFSQQKATLSTISCSPSANPEGIKRRFGKQFFTIFVWQYVDGKEVSVEERERVDLMFMQVCLLCSVVAGPDFDIE
jgi:hypothetical protein